VKQKILIGCALVFFLSIQFLYFWELRRGISFSVMFFLVVTFAVLGAVWIYKVVKAARHNFRHRNRNIMLIIVGLVLLATMYKPFGLIDYENWNSCDVLVAVEKNAVNCNRTLRLKDNFTFTQIFSCFSISKDRGTYTRRGDSVFFTNHPDKFDYAIIRKPQTASNNIGWLMMHRFKEAHHEIDTVAFLITKLKE
jgi:hypothetical protein